MDGDTDSEIPHSPIQQYKGKIDGITYIFLLICIERNPPQWKPRKCKRHKKEQQNLASLLWMQQRFAIFTHYFTFKRVSIFSLNEKHIQVKVLAVWAEKKKYLHSSLVFFLLFLCCNSSSFVAIVFLVVISVLPLRPILALAFFFSSLFVHFPHTIGHTENTNKNKLVHHRKRIHFTTHRDYLTDIRRRCSPLSSL